MTTIYVLIIGFAVGLLFAAVSEIVMARRRERAHRDGLAALLDAADRAPPLPATGETIRLRRRTDPLPDNIRHGRDRLIVVARRQPRRP